MRTFTPGTPGDEYEQLLQRLLSMPISEEGLFEDEEMKQLMQRLIREPEKPPMDLFDATKARGRLLDEDDDDEDDDDDGEEVLHEDDDTRFVAPPRSVSNVDSHISVTIADQELSDREAESYSNIDPEARYQYIGTRMYDRLIRGYAFDVC